MMKYVERQIEDYLKKRRCEVVLFPLSYQFNDGFANFTFSIYFHSLIMGPQLLFFFHQFNVRYHQICTVLYALQHSLGRHCAVFDLHRSILERCSVQCVLFCIPKPALWEPNQGVHAARALGIRSPRTVIRYLLLLQTNLLFSSYF